MRPALSPFCAQMLLGRRTAARVDVDMPPRVPLRARLPCSLHVLMLCLMACDCLPVACVKFGSSSLTIPIRDSQHSGKECVLSLGRSPVEVAMAWMGGLALLSARSLAMPMRGLGCP